ncbi:MAG: hypothetical protein QF860_02035 [Planctomycetota bacterium]|nr:hypothetical protein [Planctomycetota bacterium]
MHPTSPGVVGAPENEYPGRVRVPLPRLAASLPSPRYDAVVVRTIPHGCE